MLSKEAIAEFKELYLKHYKVELADGEASLRANNLMFLYRAVYGELPISNKNKTYENNGKSERGEEAKIII